MKKQSLLILMSVLALTACSNSDNSKSKEISATPTKSQSAPQAESQNQVQKEESAEGEEHGEMKPRRGAMNRKGKAIIESQPYAGVFTSEGKVEGLYAIKPTGVSTAAIVNTANDLLASLSAEQKQKIQFDVDSDEWRYWANVDNGGFIREGVSIKDMNDAQRELGFKLLQESLSKKGYQLSRNIMKTDQTAHEITGEADFGEDLYFFTIMGTPSATQPWGWQFEGHHLAINYFVLGDQVVMSPVFMGAEPVITTTGKYKGNTLFQDEQNYGLKFMQSLTAEQQKQATLNPEKGEEDNQAAAFMDNVTLDYQGIAAKDLSKEHKEALLNLAKQYVSNMRDGHAKVKMADIEKHIDNTWFAWTGAVTDDAVFYYRIHSPVVLIEFDHQAPGPAGPEHDNPTRDHIHTIVRTPNGNDYGKDLLRQHKEKYHSH